MSPRVKRGPPKARLKDRKAPKPATPPSTARKSFKVIARELGMSEQAARNHSRPIHAQLKVKSRAELIFELIRRGWR